MADEEERTLRDDLDAAFAEVEDVAPVEAAAPEAAAVEPEAAVSVSEDKPTDDRPRDAEGKFVKQDDKPAEPAAAAPVAEKPAEPPQEAAQAATEPLNAEPTAESMAGQTPPPGFSIAAKQAWAETPPAIREAIAKRETEINNGFAKLKDYSGLDSHVEMARAQGQELPQVLDNYVAAERLLQSDFVGGVKWLAQSYGVDLNQLAGALGMQPAQNGQDTAAVPQVDLSPVTSKINQLEQEIGQFKQAQESQVTDWAQSELEKFANNPEHVYFQNVDREMGILIQNGLAQDLEDAYQQACWRNPEIRAELIKKQSATEAEAIRQKEQEAVNKAKQAAQGVGSDIQAGSTAPPGSNGTLRDTLYAAWEDAEGRI